MLNSQGQKNKASLNSIQQSDQQSNLSNSQNNNSNDKSKLFLKKPSHLNQNNHDELLQTTFKADQEVPQANITLQKNTSRELKQLDYSFSPENSEFQLKKSKNSNFNSGSYNDDATDFIIESNVKFSNINLNSHIMQSGNLQNQKNISWSECNSQQNDDLTKLQQNQNKKYPLQIDHSKNNISTNQLLNSKNQIIDYSNSGNSRQNQFMELDSNQINNIDGSQEDNTNNFTLFNPKYNRSQKIKQSAIQSKNGQGLQKSERYKQTAKFIEDNNNKQLKEKERIAYFRQKFTTQKLKNQLLNLLSNTESRRFKNLSKNQFQQINDKAYYYVPENAQKLVYKQSQKSFKKISSYEFLQYYEETWQTKLKQSFFNYKRKLIDTLSIHTILKPESPLVFFYDLLSAFLVFIWIFIYSFDIFFSAALLQKNLNIKGALYFSMFFFLSEIFLRFYVGFYSNGHFIVNKKKIAYRYWTQSLSYDITGFISLFYILASKNLNKDDIDLTGYFFEFLFFFKYKSLLFTSNRIEQALYIKGIKSHYIELFKMLLRLILMCHIISILWHLLHYIQINWLDIHETWFTINGLVEKSWLQKYVQTFYWSISTVMLIGSKGESDLETFFTSFTLLVTVGVFAYIISNISMILEELNQKATEYKRDLEIINRFMESKVIEIQLQSKVRSYLEYNFKAQGETTINKEAQQVLEKLPRSMKDQIQTQINENIIKQFPFMWQQFSKKTQDDVLLIMEEQTCVTNEYIFHQDENIEPSLYLIIKGQVEITYKVDGFQKETVICQVKSGQVLGDMNLITGQLHAYSAKCTSFVNLCKIERNKFLQILKNNSEDFERFHMIKEEIMFSSYSNYYIRNCYICGKTTHQENNCNLICYRPSNYSVNMKQNYQERQQQRQRFYRAQNLVIKPLSELFDELEIVREKLFLNDEIMDLFQKYDYFDSDDDEYYYYEDWEEDDNDEKEEEEEEESELKKEQNMKEKAKQLIQSHSENNLSPKSMKNLKFADEICNLQIEQSISDINSSKNMQEQQILDKKEKKIKLLNKIQTKNSSIGEGDSENYKGDSYYDSGNSSDYSDSEESEDFQKAVLLMGGDMSSIKKQKRKNSQKKSLSSRKLSEQEKITLQKLKTTVANHNQNSIIHDNNDNIQHSILKQNYQTKIYINNMDISNESAQNQPKQRKSVIDYLRQKQDSNTESENHQKQLINQNQQQSYTELKSNIKNKNTKLKESQKRLSETKNPYMLSSKQLMLLGQGTKQNYSEKNLNQKMNNSNQTVQQAESCKSQLKQNPSVQKLQANNNNNQQVIRQTATKRTRIQVPIKSQRSIQKSVQKSTQQALDNGLKSMKKMASNAMNTVQSTKFEDDVMKLVQDKLQKTGYSESVNVQDLIRKAKEELHQDFINQFDQQKNFKIFFPLKNLSYLVRVYKSMQRMRNKKRIDGSGIWSQTYQSTKYFNIKNINLNMKQTIKRGQSPSNNVSMSPQLRIFDANDTSIKEASP